METGTHKGFLPEAIEILKQKAMVDDSKIFPWRVYTEKDFLLEAKSQALNKGIGTFTFSHISISFFIHFLFIILLDISI